MGGINGLHLDVVGPVASDIGVAHDVGGRLAVHGAQAVTPVDIDPLYTRGKGGVQGDRRAGNRGGEINHRRRGLHQGGGGIDRSGCGFAAG